MRAGAQGRGSAVQKVIKGPLLHVFLPRLHGCDCISSVAKAEGGRAGWARRPLCCSATMHICCMAAKTWKSSVAGREKHPLALVERLRLPTPRVSARSRGKREAQSGGNATVWHHGSARRCNASMWTSPVISDIKGQAVHSRWFFCWTVSLVLDSDLILCKWKLLTRLCCQTGGNFHTAKCASRRTWTHAQH